MGEFDLGVQSESSRPEVRMKNEMVLDLPMGLGPDLMPVVGAYGFDPTRKLFRRVVDEFDGTSLHVSRVIFKTRVQNGVIHG
jgi:hypothetical protein